MLGCILLAVELVIAILAPVIGIPLLLLTILAMVVVAVLRGGIGVGRKITRR